MFQWIVGTVLILAMILLAGRALAHFARRMRAPQGPAAEIGSWRVAPDLRLRALRVGESVHLVAESRSGLCSLESLTLAEFQQRFAAGDAARLRAPLLVQRFAQLLGASAH